MWHETGTGRLLLFCLGFEFSTLVTSGLQISLSLLRSLMLLETPMNLMDHGIAEPETVITVQCGMSRGSLYSW